MSYPGYSSIFKQSVVYKFEGGWCDASYVGYTRRYLYQRINEQKRSGSIFNDSESQHQSQTITCFAFLRNASANLTVLSSIQNVPLMPVLQMEVGCSRIWGLTPTTQTQVGGTPHKPALTATQPRAPPATPDPKSSTRHTEQ